MEKYEDMGVQTQPMDTSTQEFRDFQLQIQAKNQNATLEEKIIIKMLGLKFKMEDYLNSEFSNQIPVGHFVKQALTKLNIKHKNFAKYIDLKGPNLSKLLKGERKINMEQALIFENLFNIKAELWIAIQTKNQLAQLEKLNRKNFKRYQIKDLVYEG